MARAPLSIPTSVRVGPLRYSVLIDADKIREASDEADIGDNEWAAFSDHDALVIGINPKAAEDVQRRDLVHELLHCCLRVAGAWPSAYADIVAEARGRHDGLNVEEFAVAATAGPLLGILRDNPDLLVWLVEEASVVR